MLSVYVSLSSRRILPVVLGDVPGEGEIGKKGKCPKITSRRLRPLTVLREVGEWNQKKDHLDSVEVQRGTCRGGSKLPWVNPDLRVCMCRSMVKDSTSSGLSKCP